MPTTLAFRHVAFEDLGLLETNLVRARLDAGLRADTERWSDDLLRRGTAAFDDWLEGLGL